MSTELTREERTYLESKIIIRAIAGTVCLAMLSLTTCVMHSNTYNEAQGKVVTIKVQAEVEMSKQKHLEGMERLKVVENLISNKQVDPIAARCAVEGWTDKTSAVCLALITQVQPVPVTLE